MAGRKENPVLTACQAPSGRITRAQAAANRGRFGFAPSVSLPARTERKQTAKGKTKRGALDEITSASTATSAPQPKRRTVLKDVTNIGCANSSKNCTTTSKLQVSRAAALSHYAIMIFRPLFSMNIVDGVIRLFLCSSKSQSPPKG